MDKFEIVEFYPINEFQKKYKIIGTIHIYLCDLDIDIRGLKVRRSAGQFFVQMPHLRSWDFEENKEVMYPVFSFMDHERTKKLILDIREQIEPFLKKWFKENRSDYLKDLKKISFYVPKKLDEKVIATPTA